MKLAKFILIITGSLALVYVVFDKLTHKWLPDCQFNFIIGPPGVGKSLLFCKIADKAFRQHRHVYSSEPIKVEVKVGRHEKAILETKVIDAHNLPRYQFPHGSVVLVDEVGILFNNRSWKTFSKEMLEHIKRYRHDHVTYWIASQNMDADKVIRDVTTQYWLMNKVLRVWTVARRLVTRQVVVEPTAENPGSIQQGFKEDPKLLRPVLGGMMVAFIPHWARMYDSYYIPESQRKRRDIDYTDDPLPIPYPAKRHPLSDLWASIFYAWRKKRLARRGVRLYRK